VISFGQIRSGQDRLGLDWLGQVRFGRARSGHVLRIFLNVLIRLGYFSL